MPSIGAPPPIARPARWPRAHVTLVFLIALAAVTSARAGVVAAPDSFSHIIATSDEVVLASLVTAGTVHGPLPGPKHMIVDQPYVRFAVQRRLAGSDTARTITIYMIDYNPLFRRFRQENPGRPVILYLRQIDDTLWIINYDHRHKEGEPSVGIELPTSAELAARVPKLAATIAGLSCDSLAAQADLIVQGAVFAPDPRFHVTSVIAGDCPDSLLTVETGHPGDLHRGDVLLLLRRRNPGRFEVLGDGAGCLYLDKPRIARSTSTREDMLQRVRASASGRIGGRAH